MTDVVRAVACLLACVSGWLAALTLMSHANPMFNVKAILHVVAAMVPGLSVLVAHAPAPVAIVCSAILQLVALYSAPPASAPKSSSAGYVHRGVLALLCVVSIAAVIGCAAFRAAEKDPASAVAKAKAEAAVVGADVAKACADLVAAEKANLVPHGKVKDDVDAFCTADAAWRAAHP